jgi:hypothetical protein
MRRQAQRRNPIQMTEFQELVQQTHATATEWQPSTVNPHVAIWASEATPFFERLCVQAWQSAG